MSYRRTYDVMETDVMPDLIRHLSLKKIIRERHRVPESFSI